MFEASFPVFGSGFYNRNDELARLGYVVERLRQGSPKWLLIVGSRKVGKTSLLTELARRVGAKPPVVILDVQQTAPVSNDFFRSYGLKVVDALWTLEHPISLESLAREPEEYREELQSSNWVRQFPRDVQRFVLRLPDMEMNTSAIRAILDLPERLADVLGCPLIIAIDEFQELAQLADRRRQGVDPMPIMRSIWQHHRRVSYVVSGSARRLLLDLVAAQHSPFYQHFDVMELGVFSPEDAVTLLRSNGAPSTFGETQLMTVSQALGHHPFYLQLFGEVLVEMAQYPGADADPDSLSKAAVQRLVFDRAGRLNLYFKREFDVRVGRAATLATTLSALADGPLGTSELARRVGATPGSAFHYIERLADLVELTDDGRHRLVDPVFALWLQWRKPGGTVVPMRILGDEAELAVARHLARSGFELVYQSRGSRGAFDLLAIRGPMQLGVQVKRASVPFSMVSTEVKRILADSRRLGWHAVVAAVDPQGAVEYLDIRQVRTAGKTVRLRRDQVVENILSWPHAG